MSYSGKFKDKNNNLHPVTSVLYGTCDTAAATAAKVVTCTDFDTLMTGVTIRVKFANANTAASPTVNINSTGAKSVYRFGSTAPVDGNSWNAGEVVELVYDGTSFFMTGADDIAAKQDATDNSLETEAKTIVGAINEHEGDISSLKSGLTTLDDEVNGDATTYPYADVITIEDAVPANLADCNVKIEPVQDLHGYDKPWVGGAGKNKWPSGLTWHLNGNGTFDGSTDDDSTIRARNCPATEWPYGQGTFTISNYPSKVTHLVAVACFDSNKTKLNDATIDKFTFTTVQNTAYILILFGGENFTVSDFANVELQVEAGNQATTYEPYSNICPITGHTEASVQRDGKNWFDYTKATANYRVNIDNGNLEVQSGFYASDYIEVFAQQTFTLNYVYSSLAQYGMAFYDANKTFVSGRKQKQTEGDTTFTYTVPNGCKYVRFTVPTDITVSSVQMELSSSATDYEPYKGKTYTIALGDTIYGGTVDFDSGVMTVDRKIYTISSTSDFVRNVDFPTNRFISTNISDGLEAGSLISNKYVKIQAGYNISGAYIASTHGIRINTNGTYSSLQDALDGELNGAQFVYALATPTTIQLTPQQIQLLKGQNTLTASTGQISVTVNGVSGSIGSLTSDKQDKTDYALETTAKTVVGAINEVQSDLTDYDTSQLFTVFFKAFGNIAIISGRFTGDNTSSISIGIGSSFYGPVNVRNRTTGEMSIYNFNNGSISGWDGSNSRVFTDGVVYEIAGVLYKG